LSSSRSKPHLFLCRWAFVDFTSIEHATAVLINPKNYRMDGRKLVVEYASADAVRRGGGAVPKLQKSEGWDVPKKLDQQKRERKRTKPLDEELAPAATTDEGRDGRVNRDGRQEPPHKKRRQFDSQPDRGGPRAKSSRNRTKPGAALASAKRESAAIIPSQGQKIKF
jgi:RNA recognition motif-containing protein